VEAKCRDVQVAVEPLLVHRHIKPALAVVEALTEVQVEVEKVGGAVRDGPRDAYASV
jgi:hypothetical protein